jgi:hypothetical protein
MAILGQLRRRGWRSRLPSPQLPRPDWIAIPYEQKELRHTGRCIFFRSSL